MGSLVGFSAKCTGSQAVDRGAVRQDAEDLLGLWLVPHFAHADVTHDILIVLLPFKVQALKWNRDLLGMVWLRLRPLEITMIAVGR